MLGKRPKNAASPDLNNCASLNLPNSPDIAQKFCMCPEGSYLVESISFGQDSFKVVLRKPNSKIPKSQLIDCPNQRDFTVWVVEPNGDLWMPTHLSTLEAFAQMSQIERGKVYMAIQAVVIEYAEPITAAREHGCDKLLLGNYPALLVLSYLKWLAALEDTLYPPPKYLGRKMAFAGYVLVHSGVYNPQDLQRVLKVFSR